MSRDFTGILQGLLHDQSSLFHMSSTALDGWSIHVENPNNDPNNPHAYYYDFMVWEHLDGNTGGSLSHEVDALSHKGGVWIEGDQEGWAIANDGLEGEPGYNDCHGWPEWSEPFHDTYSNLGHFSQTNLYKHFNQGRSFADIIRGTTYNDVLDGKTGNDILYGNGGNDILYGREGNDELHGGDGIDYLIGGKGGDILYGDAHDDYLEGDAGNDTMYGGTGNDLYIFTAGDGADFVYEEANTEDGEDVVDFADATNLWVFKLGNDMILTADPNVQDVVYIKDFGINHGLDYIYMGGLGGAYDAEQAWSIAQDLGAAVSAFNMDGTNSMDTSNWVSITTLDMVDVELAGIQGLLDMAENVAA